MTTAERTTMAAFNAMNVTEQYNFKRKIDRLFAKREAKRKMEPITKAEFVRMIDESIEQSKRGEVISWEDLREKSIKKYGLKV